MIFLTTGTQFPFDRLVRAVDEIFDKDLIDEEIFAQIGYHSYKPRNFESVAYLEKERFETHLRRASSIIGHAGMGTITMALDNHKPLLTMPRLKKYGEVVSDHQIAIAKKLENLGHILVAYGEEDLPDKIRELKSFVPRPRVNQAGVVTARLSEFLYKINTSKE